MELSCYNQATNKRSSKRLLIFVAGCSPRSHAPVPDAARSRHDKIGFAIMITIRRPAAPSPFITVICYHIKSLWTVCVSEHSTTGAGRESRRDDNYY